MEFTKLVVWNQIRSRSVASFVQAMASRQPGTARLLLLLLFLCSSTSARRGRDSTVLSSSELKAFETAHAKAVAAASTGKTQNPERGRRLYDEAWQLTSAKSGSATESLSNLRRSATKFVRGIVADPVGPVTHFSWMMCGVALDRISKNHLASGEGEPDERAPARSAAAVARSPRPFYRMKRLAVSVYGEAGKNVIVAHPFADLDTRV